MKTLKHIGVVVDGEGLSGTTKSQYESWTAALLVELSLSVAPQAIFYRIKTYSSAFHEAVRIVPWNDADAKKHGSCNATGNRWGEDSPGFRMINGRATIHYSPSTWATGICGTNPDDKPATVLLHELVHAARFAGSDLVFKQKPLEGAMAKYKDEEEYFAVLITNIYLSEKGEKKLRQDYTGVTPPSDRFYTSGEFLNRDENLGLVRKFCEQHPKVAPRIAEANVEFNPIRLYLELKKSGVNPANIDLSTFEDLGSPRVRQTGQVVVGSSPIVLSGDVLFEFDKHTLKPSAISALQFAGSQIKQHTGKHIVVQGFADSTGGDGYNLKLSTRRAEEVKNWLVLKGYVNSTDISCKGYGEDFAVASNATAAGRAKNRRVEILVVNSAPRL